LLARWREALKRAGIDHPDGFPFVPRWSADSALALMDEVGIGMALLSISSPGLSFVTGNERSSLARAVNEDGAAAVRDHSDRFGLFASLPLPDVDAALEEVAHASQTLHADGFVLMTNYDGGLPRRQAARAGDGRVRTSRRTRPRPLAARRSPSAGLAALIEFILDTTRAVANLILTGTLERHARLSVIVPHVGSALPSLADRLNGFSKIPSTENPLQKIDVYGTLARLHYDVAGKALPHGLPGLLAIASAERLLYASDTPFTPPNLIQADARALVETDVLDDSQRHGLFTDNAEQLSPGWLARERDRHRLRGFEPLRGQ